MVAKIYERGHVIVNGLYSDRIFCVGLNLMRQKVLRCATFVATG